SWCNNLRARPITRTLLAACACISSVIVMYHCMFDIYNSFDEKSYDVVADFDLVYHVDDSISEYLSRVGLYYATFFLKHLITFVFSIQCVNILLIIRTYTRRPNNTNITTLRLLSWIVSIGIICSFIVLYKGKPEPSKEDANVLEIIRIARQKGQMYQVYHCNYTLQDNFTDDPSEVVEQVLELFQKEMNCTYNYIYTQWQNLEHQWMIIFIYTLLQTILLRLYMSSAVEAVTSMDKDGVAAYGLKFVYMPDQVEEVSTIPISDSGGFLSLTTRCPSSYVASE
ncbi:hypothetical protein SK128_001314, partial [Halocaridina rubra]